MSKEGDVDFTPEQLGALRVCALDPDEPGIQMTWSAISGLPPEDRQTLIAILLLESLRD